MRIVFLGSADLSAIMLNRLLKTPGMEVVGVITQPDKPAGRSKCLTPCPCKKILKSIAAEVECYTPEKVNAPEALAQIRAWQPDVIVVVAYGQFLCKELLAIPRHGCLNIHLSLLPRYRGAAPIHAAVLNGDRETGVTAMLMDEGMDSGDILMLERTPIHANETVESLHFRLALLGADLLVKVLPLWVTDDAKKRIKPIKQDPALVTIARKIKKHDGLLVWAAPSDLILRKIRAFTPWPGNIATMPGDIDSKAAGKLLKILSAEGCCALCEGDADQKPGTILRLDSDGLVVRTGDGAISIATLQVEGGKPLTVEAFLCGHALKPGQIFGTPAC